MNFETLDADACKRDIWSLMEELFPLHRTLVGDGFDRSLAIVGRRLPLKVLEVPSGKEVWDWRVPPAWDVREAYIQDESGRRLVEQRLHALPLDLSHPLLCSSSA